MVRDDSIDNWESERCVFELMDPNKKKNPQPQPNRSPPVMPYFTIPVPASCFVVLANCDDTFIGHMLDKDGQRLSFHYFHPNVPEVLMYPKARGEPTGRDSLEWYQVAMMRYRDPAMSTYGEMDDIWDKLTNPKYR